MRRRDFIAALGGAAAWPLRAVAQPALPVVGFLNSGAPAANSVQVDGFRDGFLHGCDDAFLEQFLFSPGNLSPGRPRRRLNWRGRLKAAERSRLRRRVVPDPP